MKKEGRSGERKTTTLGTQRGREAGRQGRNEVGSGLGGEGEALEGPRGRERRYLSLGLCRCHGIA